MATVVRTLKETDPEAWESLQRMSGGYLHGECYAFAIALHQGFGWPLMGLIDPSGVITNAVVQDPDGSFWDIRGKLTADEVVARFNVVRIESITVADLYRTRTVIGERVIESARRTAETLWPELPWQTTAVKQVAAFVEELEALCRKHQLYIWGSIPTHLPKVSPIDEDWFRGYVIKPMIHGTTFMLDHVDER